MKRLRKEHTAHAANYKQSQQNIDRIAAVVCRALEQRREKKGGREINHH